MIQNNFLGILDLAKRAKNDSQEKQGIFLRAITESFAESSELELWFPWLWPGERWKAGERRQCLGSEKLSVIGDVYINLSPECVTYAM